MVRWSQGIITMKSSITDDDLSTMVNYDCRTSGIREIKRVHAPGMQALTILIDFLGKEIHQYPSSTKGINVVSTL